MFILTDGKNYVMENPMKAGQYISTTSPIQAIKEQWSIGKIKAELSKAKYVPIQREN